MIGFGHVRSRSQSHSIPSERSRPLRAPILGNHVQRFQQGAKCDRLAQELVEAAFQGPHSVIQNVATRYRDNPHAEQRGVLTKASRRLEAVNLRHIQIEECCIGFDAFTQLDSFSAVPCGRHFDADVPQHRQDGVSEDLIVFGVGRDETRGVRASGALCKSPPAKQTRPSFPVSA